MHVGLGRKALPTSLEVLQVDLLSCSKYRGITVQVSEGAQVPVPYIKGGKGSRSFQG